jgi:hypothetical protein
MLVWKAAVAEEGQWRQNISVAAIERISDLMITITFSPLFH